MNLTLFLALAMLISAGSAPAAESFVPDFRVKTDDYTVLMSADAKLPPGMKPFQPGGHGKFHVTGWTSPEQSLEWDITVPQEDAYAVNVLLRRHGNRPLNITVTAAGQRLDGTVPDSAKGWLRYPLDQTVRLPAGRQRIVLQARSSGADAGFNASVFSIELVRPAVRERLHASALKLRSDTRWLQDCRFGLLCHWTSQSFPRRGERKPYAQAVQDFDVESFANQVQATGAGFVVFTTSHAEHFFPAPLESLDRILPGRTSRRDLVGELAEALGRRGVKLLLYYHLGAKSDPAWLKATGFWDTDTTRFFNNWVAIVSEVGRRYADKLAGWWFDDGAVSYYYRSAPWERLATAAKAGYAGRLVGFNPWELPSATEFQDFFCGEGNGDPSVGGLLTVGGDGHLMGGSHQGLQACATLITEADWVHARKNIDIGPPRWNAQRMATLLKDFSARKNVPIFNLEIYQGGTLSPATVDMFKQAGDVRGVHFTPLNGDKPVFTPPDWLGQNLTRDPKLGRLRGRLDPDPFVSGADFRQELKLRHGFVEIAGKRDGVQATISVWTDVFRPVIHVEISASQPIGVSAAYENWRQSDVSLPAFPHLLGPRITTAVAAA